MMNSGFSRLDRLGKRVTSAVGAAALLGALSVVACAPPQDPGAVQARAAKLSPATGPITLKGKARRIDRRDDPQDTLCEVFDGVGPAPTYEFGRLVSNVQVVQVLYGTGDYTPEVAGTATPNMATFYQNAVDGPFVDWLAEYDTDEVAANPIQQGIGRGSFAGRFAITPSAPNAGPTVSDASIQAELAAQIQAGNLPAPTHDLAGNDNTTYAVFFPKGTLVTAGTELAPSDSCSGFCSYHSVIEDAAGAGEVYYSVHPDLGQRACPTHVLCQGLEQTDFDRDTVLASHELVDTITDPEAELGNPGWLITNCLTAPVAFELSDVCAGRDATIVGGDGASYRVQTAFSAAANGCVSSRPLVPRLAVAPALLSGGSVAVGTVTLGADAPPGGVTVALTSSAPALLGVPASVLVPAGRPAATFPVTSAPVTTDTTVQLSADLAGTTVTETMTVLAPPAVASFTLSPSSVTADQPFIGTVTLTAPAPPGGANVTVSTLGTVLVDLVIPEGSTTGTLEFIATPEPFVQVITILASLGGVTRTATAHVAPILELISFDPVNHLFAVPFGGTLPVTVTLNDRAPDGGVAVSLASNNPGLVSAPATVTVQAGQTSATFSLVGGTPADTSGLTTISATFPDTNTLTMDVSLLSKPTFVIDTDPRAAHEGDLVSATITLFAHSPAGGKVVSLPSIDGSAFGTLAVTIPEGLTTFTVPRRIRTLDGEVSRVDSGGQLSNGFPETSRVFVTTRKELPLGNAVFDPALGAPRCDTFGSFCDSGGLVDGRGRNAPLVFIVEEPNAPNTIHGDCRDDLMDFPLALDPFHTVESLDHLRIATVDGSTLAPGKRVRVDATVWSESPDDALDIFVAADATAPSWTYVATLPAPLVHQATTLSTTFTLPAGSQQAIRGNFRRGGSPGTCTASGADERDDLVFAVQTGPDTTPPSIELRGSAPGAAVTGDVPLTAHVTDAESGVASVDFLVDTVSVGTVTARPYRVVWHTDRAFPGHHTLSVVARDGAGNVAVSADLPVTGGRANMPPTVAIAPGPGLGGFLQDTVPDPVALDGTVTDDGLPLGSRLTARWSASGLGQATFADPTAPRTTVTFTIPSFYDLFLAASDGIYTTTANASVDAFNLRPVVSAGPDLTITLPAAASLAGSATDDGLPFPPTLATTWSKLSGPGTVIFADATAPVTTATFSKPGTYVLRLTANDTAVSVSDDATIAVKPAPVNHPPRVSAGPDRTITLPQMAMLAGTATDDGLPDPPGALTTTWTKVSGPGAITFADAHAATTKAAFAAPGRYVLRLTASDGALSSKDDVVVQAVAYGRPPDRE